MSGLDNLKKRLQYDGGNAEGRLINDKLKSLQKALLYSYQAATIILKDDREFRCLINPNKETGDYDTKIISIPYEDICLNSENKPPQKTSQGREVIGLKCGDVVTWKETDTHWLVFLEYLEEDAYFRAQIRKCEQETEINGKRYWTYIRGPVETSTPWNQKAGVEWNDMNYSLIMYVTRDDNTMKSLHRFSKIKIVEPHTGEPKTWQVVGVNPYYGDGIIQIALDEFFENTIEEEAAAEKEANKKPETKEEGLPNIVGPREVSGFDTVTYAIENVDGGEWYVLFNNELLSYGSDNSITLDINMRKGSFSISYKKDDIDIATANIIVKPY